MEACVIVDFGSGLVSRYDSLKETEKTLNQTRAMTERWREILQQLTGELELQSAKLQELEFENQQLRREGAPGVEQSVAHGGMMFSNYCRSIILEKILEWGFEHSQS